MRLFVPLALVAATVVGAACGSGDADSSAEERDLPPGYVIDSALPIDTLLARFRATVADTPQALRGGETSPERLTRRFLAAISARDTATLQRLIISRSEYAWLYYPHSRFTQRPYELYPELLWIQLSSSTESGITRMLHRYGGSSMRLESVVCDDSSVIEGPNEIIRGCRVRFAAADSSARTMRLFGDLLARDGQLKFLSYANDL